MQIIYIILLSTLISGLFCFSFFFGFSLGIKNGKPKGEEIEIDEDNVDAYMEFRKWMNYTSPKGGIE